jgi:DNA-binding response OmpR family regulator
MPSILAIVNGTPPALEGASVSGPGLLVERRSSPRGALDTADSTLYDLLVLAGFPIETQQEIATTFQERHRWRLVPVLYVLDPAAPGLIIPASYRPELDGIVRGRFGDAAVEARIRQLAREGVASANFVVAGPFELDPVRGRLSCDDLAIELTEREAEIMAVLLERLNDTVSASEIIERSWGAVADDRHRQILRRHVSNIRRKLHARIGAAALQTVRGFGYRVNAPEDAVPHAG